MTYSFTPLVLDVIKFLDQLTKRFLETLKMIKHVKNIILQQTIIVFLLYFNLSKIFRGQSKTVVAMLLTSYFLYWLSKTT